MRYAEGLLEDHTSTLDLSQLENDLCQINGIGQKRLEEIMAVIKKHNGIPE